MVEWGWGSLQGPQLGRTATTLPTQLPQHIEMQIIPLNP